MSGIFLKPKKIHSHFNPKADIVLFQGDSLHGLKEIENEKISLIVSSPPYNLGKIYEKEIHLEKYLDRMIPYIDEFIRILSPKGSLCWQVGNYVLDTEVFPLDIFYYPLFKNRGLQLRNRIIWHFDHGLHASKRFSGRYEVLLWFTKTDEYVFNLDSVRVPAKYPGKTNYKPGKQYGKPSGNPLGKNPSDLWTIVTHDWEHLVWDIPNVKSNHCEKTIHPCQFPIELIQRCVLALTNEGDWVLDPFAGVGSAIIAAIMHDRKGIGLEQDKNYINISKERIEQYFAGTLRIRPLGKPVHIPTGKEKVSQVPQEWKNGNSIYQDELL